MCVLPAPSLLCWQACRCVFPGTICVRRYSTWRRGLWPCRAAVGCLRWLMGGAGSRGATWWSFPVWSAPLPAGGRRAAPWSPGGGRTRLPGDTGSNTLTSSCCLKRQDSEFQLLFLMWIKVYLFQFYLVILYLIANKTACKSSTVMPCILCWSWHAPPKCFPR